MLKHCQFVKALNPLNTASRTKKMNTEDDQALRYIFVLCNDINYFEASVALQTTNMDSQTFWNMLHELIIQANENSDLVILTQIALSFSVFFLPERSLSTISFVVYLFALHFLTELLLAMPGFPVLKSLCTLLSWGAKFQILSLYFGWFTTKSSPIPRTLEFGVGPNGNLEWLTPVRKRQARRVEGIIFPKFQDGRADTRGRRDAGASGRIEWPKSMKFDGPKVVNERKYQPGYDHIGVCNLSKSKGEDGMGLTRRKRVELGDWRKELDTRPLGHLEWLTKRYDDIRDDIPKKAAESDDLLEQDTQVPDPAIFNPDGTFQQRLQNAIRKTVPLPESAERARFRWDDLANGKSAFT